MLGELLEIGDRVIITIPGENREWGYAPCEDGTVGKVLGFGEIAYSRVSNYGLKPGIYQNRSWVDIELPSGEKINISSCFIEMQDKDEFASRDKKRINYWENKANYFLRDLPSLPFWEGDIVRVLTPHLKNYEFLIIINIEYGQLDWKRNDGSPFPIYVLSDKFGSGWSMTFCENEIELVSHGNVWKHYHSEAISFSSLKEEAEFADLLGLTSEVRNPASGLFSWTLEEILASIKDGVEHGFGEDLPHGFSISGGLFVGDPSHNAMRFKDKQLGLRVALATLEGFANKV